MHIGFNPPPSPFFLLKGYRDLVNKLPEFKEFFVILRLCIKVILGWIDGISTRLHSILPMLPEIRALGC